MTIAMKNSLLEDVEGKEKKRKKEDTFKNVSLQEVEIVRIKCNYVTIISES